MDAKTKQHKKDNRDIVNKIVGGVFEEAEKVGQSATSQVSGDNKSDQPNPIAEAMQQKTEDEEIEKQNKLNNQRKFIRTQEELNEDLKKAREEDQKKKEAWKEDVERQFKIIDPGQKMAEEVPIPMSSKPKRGQVPGMPGTAKGGTGPEVRRSKQ